MSCRFFSTMVFQDDTSIVGSCSGLISLTVIDGHHEVKSSFCSPQIATQFPSLPITSFHFLSFNLQIRPFLSPAWSTIAISQPQGSTCFDQSPKAWVAWRPRCFAFVESMENDFEMDYPSACYHDLNIWEEFWCFSRFEVGNHQMLVRSWPTIPGIWTT